VRKYGNECLHLFPYSPNEPGESVQVTLTPAIQATLTKAAERNNLRAATLDRTDLRDA
jgi:hypothetical protein